MKFETLQELHSWITLNPEDWHQHKNGGGWIYKDAKISDAEDIFIGEKAVVWGGTIWGGTIEGGTIWGGTIEGGTIRGGTIRGGTIRGGTIWGGTIWGGTIEGGTIRGGTIRGGTIRGGTIWGGTIRGGTIEGGTIRGGTIRGGTIWGGTIRGGTIRGGTIWGGTIEGGTIEGGEWKTNPLYIVGSIHDISNAKPGHIRIGCQCKPFAWWLTPEAETFARVNGYDDAAVIEYRQYIELFVKLGK